MANGRTVDGPAGAPAGIPERRVPRPVNKANPQPVRSGWEPLTLPEAAAIRTPALRYVVEGLIPAGSLTLFNGREKEGKSLAVLDLAAAVAAGEDWAGRTTTPGTVVYCPAEDRFRTVMDRLGRRIGDLTADGRPLLLRPLTGVPIRPDEPPARLDLAEPELLRSFVRMVRDAAPTLLILDCLRELHTSRENESDEMNDTMRPLRQLAHGLDVAVVVVHHASKGASGSSRGSTAIAAACDSVASWTTAHRDQEGGEEEEGVHAPSVREPLRATLRVRGRDVPLTECRLELTDGLRFVPTRRLAPAPPGAGDGSVARRRIEAALADGAWRTADEIAATTGSPLATVRYVLRLLLDADSAPIERTEPGTKGNPTRYRRRPDRGDDLTGAAVHPPGDRPGVVLEMVPGMLPDPSQPPGIGHRAASRDPDVMPTHGRSPDTAAPGTPPPTPPWDRPLAG